MRISSAERKQQLIEATVEMMRRHGVQRLNLRAIAEKAGASLATVHYCFDDKNDLLRHAVEHWLHRMVDLPDLGEALVNGLEDVAARIADAFWEALEDDPQDVLAQIELVTWAVREAPNHDLARGIYDSYETALSDVFDRALAAAGQRSTWDTKDLARAFIVVVDGAALQYITDPSSPRHQARFRRLVSLLFSDAATTAESSVVRHESVRG